MVGMRHLRQMSFTLFKELFDLRDGCRVINEDIAALRNIAWAKCKAHGESWDAHYARHIMRIANVMLYQPACEQAALLKLKI